MTRKRWKNKKQDLQKILRVCVFLSIALLPFLTVTQIIGIETFLDSFENPDYYLCFQDKDNSFGSNTKNGEYIIIQKSTHPDFNPNQNDIIIYSDSDGEILCNKIHHINSLRTTKTYYTVNQEEQVSQKPVYESQILGKIIEIVDDNIWNILSIKIWETSIHNLNLNAILTND
jgi:hypothetical protein